VNLGMDILDWCFEHIAPWLLLLFIAVFAIGTPALFYYLLTTEKITLLKAEWECTETVSRPITTYVKSGEVWVPITSYYKHCVQWTEK
jgi:hypothetical protein